MTWFVHLFTPLFRSLFGSTYAPNSIFRSFHIIFIENKVWKQVTLKHSTVFYHNGNIWLQDSTKSKNELCCRLPHAKVFVLSLKMKRMRFYYHILLLSTIMVTCVLQHSLFEGKCMIFFMQKIYKLVLMIWKAFHNIKHSSGANAQGSLPEILTLQTTNKPYRKELKNNWKKNKREKKKEKRNTGCRSKPESAAKPVLVLCPV